MPKGKWRKITLLLMIFSAALVLPMLVVGTQRSASFSKAFDRYASYLVARSWADAYAMAAPQLKSGLSFEEFSKFHESVETRLGAPRSIYRTGGEVEGTASLSKWKGHVEAIVRYEHGSAILKCWFSYSDDVWKITAIELVPNVLP